MDAASKGYLKVSNATTRQTLFEPRLEISNKVAF